MTFALYTLWIACLMLAAGELDTLLRSFLSRRFRVPYPETSWLTAVFGSACIPGLGQFLNGQPIKALFLVTWPFLTLFRAPVPPPWQMVAVKSLWFLAPAWALAVIDALAVGLILHRQRRREVSPAPGRGNDLADFLQRRRTGRR